MAKGEFKTSNGQDPQQAAVDAAVDKLNERTADANDRRGDTREKDRKAALAHQATVDKAVNEVNARIVKDNAERVRNREKDRQAALAHQKRVDDAVNELNARRPDILA